jgi:hypothetical protein
MERKEGKWIEMCSSLGLVWEFDRFFKKGKGERLFVAEIGRRRKGKL